MPEYGKVVQLGLPPSRDAAMDRSLRDWQPTMTRYFSAWLAIVVM
jgi:hypothetical protein